MAGKKKIGAIIALDGEKEFRQAVTGCNKELSNLKSQSALVKEQFDGQANTIDALRKKHEVLSKILETHQKKEEKLRDGLNHAKESYEKVGNGLASLRKDYDAANKKLEELKKSTNASSEELEEQEKAVKDLSDAIQKGENNYQSAAIKIADWETKLNTARAQTIKANRALEQNYAYMREAESSTDKCAKSIDAYGKKVKESVEATLDWSEALKAATASKLIDAGTQAVQSLGEATLGTAQDMNVAANQIQASTGIAAQSMQDYRKVMEDIYKNNYGDNFEDVGDAVSTVVQNLGELDPTKLQETTESAITLRDTFGFDFQEQIRSVKMLMDTFGISSEKAYNLIAQGAQKGLNKNGDLLDTINEYAVHYKQMGTSADEFFNSLANGTASGTFSVDKLGDAYKEFGIRVKDTAESTTEGYNILGLNADEMRAKFAAGGESAKSATAVVLSALFNMNDQVKQNQAGVDLFGTMWEDLGAQGVSALMNLNGEIASTKDVMTEIQDIKYDDMTNQLTQISRLIQMRIAEPLAEKYLPSTKKGLEALADNLDEVTTGMIGLGAVLAVYKASKSDFFLDAAKALKKMTTATEGATLAQKALNLAQSMSPAGWLMTIIAAVTAGMVAYKFATRDAKKEETAHQAEVKKLCDTTDELNEKIEENRKARQESKADIDAEYGAYQRMSDELYNLAEKENKTNEEKAYMSSLVDELNEKIPELNLKYDEQTGALNKSREAVYAYIESLEKKALVQAAEEDLTEIMKERYEAEKNLSELESKRNELIEEKVSVNSKLYAAEEEHYRKIGNGEISDYDPQKMSEYAEAAGDCEIQISELNERIGEQKDKLSESDEELETVKGILGDYKTTMDAAAESTDNLTESQSSVAEQSVQMTQEQIEAYNDLKNAIESSVDSAISAFDKFDGGTEISTEKVLENLTSQVDGISKWSDNLKTLAGAAGQGMTKEFYDYLVDMGPSSANLVQSLVDSLSNNTEDFASVCQKWTEAMNLEDSVSDELARTGIALESGVQGAFHQAATAVQNSSSQITEATGQAFDNAANTAKDKGTELSQNVAEGIEDEKDSSKNAGTNVAESMAAGIAVGATNVTNATRGVLTQANTQAGSMIPDFQTTGSNLMEGLKTGIMAKSGEIASAAAQAVRAALDASKKEADIHSPSRKFKEQVGKQIGKGMAFGIKETANLSEEEAKKMSAKVYSTANAWLKKYKKSKKTSLDDEIYYWQQVKKQLKKGTDEYEKAAKKIESMKKKKSDIQDYHLSGNALDVYKTYYKVSAKAEVDYWEKVRKQYNEGTAERLEADQKYYEAKESYNEQLEELNQEYYENCKDVNEKLAEDVQELTDTYNDAVKERKDAIYSSFGLFDQFESTSKSGSTLLYNLKTQVAGYADWQLQLEELSKKQISAGLLDELKEMGPEASASLHALNSLTEEQLAEYNALWQQKNELAQSQALKDMEDLKAQTESKIQAAKEAAQKELDSYKANYETALAELSAGMEKPLSKMADKAKKWGEKSVLNYVKSVKKKVSKKSTKAELKEATDVISTQLSTLEESGSKIGKDTLQGILDGLTNKKKIKASAKELIDVLKKEVKEAADIHSPSRLFKKEIGEQLSAGVAEGISDNTSKVNQAGIDMIKSLLENEKNRLDLQRSMLSGYLNYTNNVDGSRYTGNLRRILKQAEEQLAQKQSNLSNYLQSINGNSGIAELNNLISIAPVQQVNATVDNSNLASMFGTMLAVMQDGFEYIKGMQVVLDTGEVVGHMSDAMGNELAMKSRRGRW